MIEPTNDFSHLWNEIPFEERNRLMPHVIETQRLHIWQCKQKAILAHKRLINEFDERLSNLNKELDMFKAK